MYSSEILILPSKNTTDGFRLKNSWSGMSSESSSDSVGMPSSKASAISFSRFFLQNCLTKLFSPLELHLYSFFLIIGSLSF